VQRLAGILFEMQALDSDPNGMVRRELDLDLPLPYDRALVLGDLIALGQIGIEVILAVERRPPINLGLEAKAGTDRLSHAFAVDHGQHAGHRRIDERDVRVGLAAERG
jgi:hypothetical protein